MKPAIVTKVMSSAQQNLSHVNKFSFLHIQLKENSDNSSKIYINKMMTAMGLIKITML